MIHPAVTDLFMMMRMKKRKKKQNGQKDIERVDL